jgi:hypothetical protein
MGLHADIDHKDRRSRRSLDDQHVSSRHKRDDRMRVGGVEGNVVRPARGRRAVQLPHQSSELQGLRVSVGRVPGKLAAVENIQCTSDICLGHSTGRDPDWSIIQTSWAGPSDAKAPTGARGDYARNSVITKAVSVNLRSIAFS